MKNICKDFIKNLREYVNYLMKVGFKELFINTIIIFCIVLLSALVYAPIGIIEDLIRSFINVYFVFDGTLSLLYSWAFSLISAICCFIAFMYLFNKRFEDLEGLKESISGEKKIVKEKEKKVTKDKKDEGLDLPKAKE